MNFEIIKGVTCLSFDFGSVLLNVLAIIGLVIVGAFIITFVADWLIFICDDKNGIFFKRKKQEEEKLPERPKMLAQPEPTQTKEALLEEPSVDAQIEELTKNNRVDFEKARLEEEELKAKVALNNQIATEEDDDVDDIDQAINLLKQQEEAYKQEKVKELEERNAIFAEAEKEDAEEVEEEDDFDDDFDDEEFKRIMEALNKVDDEDDELDSIINDENGVQMAMTDEDLDTKAEESEEENSEEVQVESEVSNEPIEIDVAEEKQEQTDFEAEKSALEAEIAKLRQELEESRENLIKEREEAKAKTASLEDEKIMLEQELEKAKQDNAVVEEVLPMMSEQEYEARIETLKERLKENEKQLRRSKKEFKPLERVKNTLERDKQKLRRREAIVAKQKVVLYGVNNFVDIDEEKAQKLAEDLDLLDGLRMSVQHCEEVMENNKDRYPILEQTYNILSENNAQLKADIAEAEIALDKIKASQEEQNVETDANTNNDVSADNSENN